MIYWNGCSFVRGMEIKNRPDDIFANIVSQHFNQPWWDNAKVGGSNDRIMRTTTEDMYLKPAKLAIIIWSGLNRFEFLSHNPKSRYPGGVWRSAVWVTHRFNKKTLEIDPSSEVHFHPELTREQWNGLQGYATRIRNMRSNLISSLHNMLAVKHMLELKGIPYLFYNMSDGQWLPSKETLNEERWEGANNLWQTEHFKLDDYLELLPHMKEQAFYDMCKEAGVEFGPRDHPLEDGHQLMAKRIIEDIYDKGFDKLFS